MTESVAPVEVQPPAGSRLATLHALYREKKAAADSAAAELKAVVDGIKLELTTAATTETGVAPRVRLTGEAGPALALTWVVTKRFNSKGFRAAHESLYQQYLAPSGSWQLREAKDGDES